MTDIESKVLIKYIAPVSSKFNVIPNYLSLFDDAVRKMRESDYDFSGLTRGKAENSLTGLMAHALMQTKKEINCYIEVPNPDGGKKSREYISSETKKSDFAEENSSSMKDLVILLKENPDWENPEMYAEFKFYYNFDFMTNDSKKFAAPGDKDPSHIRENLGDLVKLYHFKRRHQKTTCVQGFYICYNPDAKKYLQGKKFGGTNNVIEFVRYYRNLHANYPEIKEKVNKEKTKEFEKDLSSGRDRKNPSKYQKLWENLVEWPNLVESIHKFSSEDMHVLPIVESKKFWLFLVIFEIRPLA